MTEGKVGLAGLGGSGGEGGVGGMGRPWRRRWSWPAWSRWWFAPEVRLLREHTGVNMVK